MQQYSDPEPIISMLKDTLSRSGANGFVIGISGGVDSALAAVLCVRAAGRSAVKGYFLPSRVTPDNDKDDVKVLEKTLGICVTTVPIGDIIEQYNHLPDFLDTPYLVGNLMARIRMTVLYYYANRYGMLVCGTSNRTEFLLGYCTKFGDNAADVQPVIHLKKSEIWEMARVTGVPEQIIHRVPTAGLWQNQTDEGELGMSYSDIDLIISNLEGRLWVPENEKEEEIFKKIQRADHKQQPAPQLKSGSLIKELT